MPERAPDGVRAVDSSLGGLPDGDLVVRAKLVGGGLAQSGRARLKSPANARIGRGIHGTAAWIPRIGERGGASLGTVGAPAHIGDRDISKIRLGLVDSTALVRIEPIVLGSHIDAPDVHVEIAGKGGRSCAQHAGEEHQDDQCVRGPFLQFTNKGDRLGSAVSMPDETEQGSQAHSDSPKRAGEANVKLLDRRPAPQRFDQPVLYPALSLTYAVATTPHLAGARR